MNFSINFFPIVHVCSSIFSYFLKSRLLCLSIAAYSVFITQRGKVSRLEGNTKQFLFVDIAERWNRRCRPGPACVVQFSTELLSFRVGNSASHSARGPGTCANTREQTAITDQTRHSREHRATVCTQAWKSAVSVWDCWSLMA